MYYNHYNSIYKLKIKYSIVENVVDENDFIVYHKGMCVLRAELVFKRSFNELIRASSSTLQYFMGRRNKFVNVFIGLADFLPLYLYRFDLRGERHNYHSTHLRLWFLIAAGIKNILMFFNLCTIFFLEFPYQRHKLLNYKMIQKDITFLPQILEIPIFPYTSKDLRFNKSQSYIYGMPWHKTPSLSTTCTKIYYLLPISVDLVFCMDDEFNLL